MKKEQQPAGPRPARQTEDVPPSPGHPAPSADAHPLRGPSEARDHRIRRILEMARRDGNEEPGGITILAPGGRS